MSQRGSSSSPGRRAGTLQGILLLPITGALWARPEHSARLRGAGQAPFPRSASVVTFERPCEVGGILESARERNFRDRA